MNRNSFPATRDGPPASTFAQPRQFEPRSDMFVVARDALGPAFLERLAGGSRFDYLAGVYAGGDIVTGAATVIQAMGAGRKAARAMKAYLGLRDTENLFVDEKGGWEEAAYIPAYIRRYPFIFSEIPGSEQLTLCVDMNKDVVDEKGAQKFFDADGKPTGETEERNFLGKGYPRTDANDIDIFTRTTQ